MFLGPFDFRKSVGVWKFFLQLANNIANGRGLWLKNNRVSSFFDDHLGALESKSLRQADCLAASVFEELGRRHIYSMYLHLRTSSGKQIRSPSVMSSFYMTFRKK